MTRPARPAHRYPSDNHNDHEFFIGQVPVEPYLPALTPSQRIIHDLLEPALTASASAQLRIKQGRSVCVLARIPHSDWVDAVHTVVARLLADGMRGNVRAIWKDANSIDFGRVIASLATEHTLVLSVGDALAEIEAIADLAIDLTSITDEQIQSALDRAFPPNPDENPQILPLPSFYDLRDLRPDYLDGAIDRAGSAIEAVRWAELATSELRRRQAEAEAETAAKLTKTSSRGVSATEILRPTAPTVGDLAGYGDAAVWATDLARDLGDYEAGVLGWADVDAGCLLVGPPGTGKTLFASALAASAGVAFVATSYAEWQSQREGHLGDVTRAIRKRFSDAAEHAPAIIFIDEIDTLPARGTASSADDWWTAITTTLLECLDGTTRREGVVVIAACNDASRLDPALVRSGRLDRRFMIELPDETALARIVAHHLPDIERDAAEAVSTVLAGTASGADIARIAREARRIARRDRRAVTADDLLSIAMPECKLSPADRRLVAIHEAGHAVVSMALGFEVNSLSIVRRDGIHGGVAVHCGETMVRVGEIERRVVGILAGRAAEEAVLGEASGGAFGDLEEATKLVSNLLGQSGLGDRLVPSAPSEAVVEARLRILYAKSLRLVTERRAAVEALSDLAIERRVLGKRAIAEFASAHGLVPKGSAA